MSRTQVKIGKHSVSLSNLDKVLYPDTGFTKGQCIDYYRRVAPVLLPHLQGRPLTLKRYPDGVEEGFFYEKRCPSHRPEWMPTVCLPSERRGELAYCSVDNLASLVWVINMASIELHTLLMERNNLQRPTVLVFDLDPGPPATIMDCIPVALHMRDMLEGLGLKAFPKTSGGKGLHFYVPLNTPVTFEHTKAFARSVAQVMERQFPERVVSRMSKQLRAGKVFIDWSQNDTHKTTVSVYSLRARSRPTVSLPVEWDELQEALDHNTPDRLQFEAHDAIVRTEDKGDLFGPVLTLHQELPG